MMHELESGWVCPECSRVWSPQVIACGMCNLALQQRHSAPGRRIPTHAPEDFTPLWPRPDDGR